MISFSIQYTKPFSITSNAQFRAPGPPALDSAAYAADLNETKSLGSATSSVRSADQTALARFGTEPPPLYWTSNLRVFATTDRSLAEHARLMALIWVTQARCDQCLLRVQVPLPVLAAVHGDRAGRHRRQRRDRRR